MIFSRKSDYGLRALVHLAEHRDQGPVTLQDISERLRIPKAFLSKILQQLVRGSIVRSIKGPSGGFVIAREPSQLTVHDIIVEIEGPLRVFECFSGGEDDCVYESPSCKILAVFNSVNRQMERVLTTVRLSDFLTPCNGCTTPEAMIPADSTAATGTGAVGR